MKRRVLIINNGDSGSTGNLSSLLNNYLNSKGHSSLFAYAYGKKSGINCVKCSNRFIQIIGAIKTRLGCNRYKAVPFSTPRLFKIIGKFKPDAVIVQCLNDYSFNIGKLFTYLKNKNIRTIVVGHALFYSTGNCGYPQNGCNQYLKECKACPNRFFATKSLVRTTRKNWIDMYNLFKDSNFIYVGVSSYVTEIAKLSPITKNCKLLTITNGVDTKVFRHVGESEHNFVRILFVCSDPSGIEKGFSQFLEIAKLTKDTNIKYILVGYYAGDLPHNVEHIGHIQSKENLAKLYNQCDLTIITSKNETFSLPIAESLCCGTPVAFFKCGGPESITIPEYSAVFEQTDICSFVKYIESKKYLKFDKKAISLKAKKIFDLDKYLDSFENLICEE